MRVRDEDGRDKGLGYETSKRVSQQRKGEKEDEPSSRGDLARWREDKVGRAPSSDAVRTGRDDRKEENRQLRSTYRLLSLMGWVDVMKRRRNLSEGEGGAIKGGGRVSDTISSEEMMAESCKANEHGIAARTDGSLLGYEVRTSWGRSKEGRRARDSSHECDSTSSDFSTEP
jgi:hypothetical protein